MAKKNTLDLTQGPIIKKLFSLVLPLIFSLVVQQLYNVADRVVVGRFAADGKDALAAVGATAATVSMILNFCNGLASGVNVRCANLKGADDEAGLRKSMHTSVLLAIVSGVALGVIGCIITKPTLQLLDTPAEILDKATLYMQIYFIAMPATTIYNFGAAILRSYGDSKRPMYILTVTGILNVLLNLVFVIVCKMDVAGVGIATAVAQAVSAIWVMWILFNKADIYKLNAGELRFHKESLNVINRIGVPAGINGMLFSLGNLTVQTAVNSFNSTAVIAGKTVATDIGSLLYQVMHAFSLANVSFAGQCYGARKYKRIDRLAITSLICCDSIVAVLALLATIFSAGIIGLFNSDPDVIAVGKSVLIINVWSYLIFTISDTYVSCNRGMGRSMGVTLMNIIGIITPRLIWVWVFFPMCRTIEFLQLCYPISFVVSSIAQVAYYRIVRRQLDKQLLQEAE